jgi:translocator protein
MAASRNSNLKIIIALSFISMVFINALAGSTNLIGGIQTRAVSDNNPTLITPAGYTFSVWGVIYLLLGAFVVFVLTKKEGDKYVDSIGWLFVLSCALNIAWIFLWQYVLLIPSVIVIILFFSTIAKAYLNLEKLSLSAKGIEKWAVHVPFSVYFGWLTIATIANITVALVSIGWNGFGIAPDTWADAIILIALLLTLAVLYKRKDITYGLVVAWALIGVSLGPNAVYHVTMLSRACAAAVVVAMGVVYAKRGGRKA